MQQPKKSLRRAINEHCKQCIYDDKSGYGTWRQQVENCTVVKCPLYPVRPKATSHVEHEEMQDA